MARPSRPPRFASGFRAVSRGDVRAPARVLLVTDDAEARDFLGQVLRTAAYDVVDVTTGSEAFARVMEGNEGAAPVIDLVLTDLRDCASGLELASALRAAASRVGLLLSSRGLTSDQRELAALYGVDVLEAPFTPDAVSGAVERALSAAA